MNVFELRRRLIDDNSAYVRSFISIRDDRIRERVGRDLDEGLLWPHPRIGLNPAFAEGAWTGVLVKQGILHPECARIFRIELRHAPESPLPRGPIPCPSGTKRRRGVAHSHSRFGFDRREE